MHTPANKWLYRNPAEGGEGGSSVEVEIGTGSKDGEPSGSGASSGSGT